MRRRKPFRQFVHLDDNPPEHITYEVHLDPPYIPEGAENDSSKWVGHYIGSAERDRLIERVYRDHGTVNGARVLEVQKATGGTWHLVRSWAGGREKEVQLKQQSGARYCPECSPHPKQADSEPTGHYRTRRQRREAQYAREAHEKDPYADMQMWEMTYEKVQDMLGGRLNQPKVPEMPDEEQLRHIKQLEANWSRATPGKQPQYELEAG
jgi:hypothetical protein